MTREERFSKIENAIESLIGTQVEHAAQIERQNAGIRDLIVAGRTVLTSIPEIQTVQNKMIEEVRKLQKLQKHTDEKLNILIDTVDRIIRSRNGDSGNI